jgi:hypothetical protein
MRVSLIVDTLKESVAHIIRLTARHIDQLNANNISLAVLALLNYDGNKCGRLLAGWQIELEHKQFDNNGSWLDELWPTGLALLAIHDCMYAQQKRFNHRAPVVRKALEYIKKTQDEKRCNWQGEFLETVLLCWVLLRLRHHQEYEFIGKAIKRLCDIQADRGFMFDIPDTALAVCAFRSANDVLKMDTQMHIERAVNWLRSWDPRGESVWNRGVLLFVLSEVNVSDAAWCESIASSLVEDFSGGIISDDYDEQAVATLALSCYLQQYYPMELGTQRVSVDNLLHLVNYEDYLRSSKESLDRLMSIINRPEPGIQIFIYTDAFVSSWSRLFENIDGFDQFGNVIGCFYKVLYESCGALKRLPQELIKDDSVVFKVKHLRTSLHHDIQHGTEPEIEKKAMMIERIYRGCCGKSRPLSIDDMRLVHVSLLTETEQFLQDLQSFFQQGEKERDT